MTLKQILALLLVVILTSCGGSGRSGEPARPSETYGVRPPEQISMLNIPLEFDVNQLESMLNRQLAGTLYEDTRFDDGDNMTVKATKRENINLRVENEVIRYRVPLGLDIRYDLGLGKVAADGDIALSFKTHFFVDSSWAVRTETTLEKHEWLETPRLRLAGMSVPVESISNFIIRRSEQRLEQSLDKLVADNFALKGYIQQAWQLMFEPQLLSEEYQAWLTVNPQRLTMTPLQTVGDKIRATITVESKPQISFGGKPVTPKASPLPPFRYAAAPQEDFTLYVGALVSYGEAERLAKQSVEGERFESGKRYVVIDRMELYGQGEELIVNLALTGSYNGNIYLTGRPVYNAERNAIDVRDLEYTLDTRNFLYKSAGWLLKSTLKNKLQDNLDFLLDYNLKDLQQQLQTQLAGYELSSGIKLNGDLREVSLYDAYLTPEGIRVSVALNGRLGLDVAGLTQMRW